MDVGCVLRCVALQNRGKVALWQVGSWQLADQVAGSRQQMAPLFSVRDGRPHAAAARNAKQCQCSVGWLGWAGLDWTD